jgi:hypothetical protein
MDSLERRHAIRQDAFPTRVFARPPWKLSPPETDEGRGIAEGAFPADFNHPDPHAGQWK